MKKLIVLILIAAACLTFAACDESTTDDTEQTKDQINKDDSEKDTELEVPYKEIEGWIEHGYNIGTLRGQEAAKYVYDWLSEHNDYKKSSEYLSKFIVVSDTLYYIERIHTDSFGQTTITVEKSYSYNKKGECFEFSELYGILRTLGVFADERLINCEYDEGGLLKEISFTSADSENHGLVIVKTTLEYDGKGNFIKADFQTSYGETWTNTYTYDETNRLIRAEVEKECDIINEFYKYSYTEEFEYDTDGKLLRKSHLMDKRPWNNTIEEYTYDENGLLKEMKLFDCTYDTPVEKRTEVYSHDSQGRIVSAEVTSGSGSYTLTYHYEDLYFYNAD